MKADEQGQTFQAFGVDPPKMLAIVQRSAAECGIEFETALRFVGSVATELRAARALVSDRPRETQ